MSDRFLKRLKTRLSRGRSNTLATDSNGIPIPPASLIHDVAGTEDVDWFLQGGQLGAETVVSTIEKQGIEFSSLDSVLDFGCGCGRVLRHLRQYESVRLHGTDISARSIAWSDQHLNFAEFGTNPIEPPTRYRSKSFDYIYAFSVFTHLTHDLQFSWMRELHRILRPQSKLLITVHGDPYLDHIPTANRRAFQNGEFVAAGQEQVGSNHCAAFHPQSFVRNTLAPETGFKVVDFVPEGALGNPKQDAYLLESNA